MKTHFFNTKLIGVLLFAISVCNIGCKKDIYQEPINSTYDQKFWTSRVSAEQATTALYGQLRAYLRQDQSHFIFGDLASGNFLPGSDQWNYTTIRAQNSPPFNFSYVPYLENSLQNWSRFYRLIAQSNLILEKIPAMSDAIFPSLKSKESYLGEALFMRAYTYFYLTRVWGDPVYVSGTYNDVDYGKIPPIARTPESQVLDSCIVDLKKAAEYLDYNGADVQKVTRASKASVLALMAHIYAWKHDYANAHTTCQQLINEGGYALEPMASYTNIWKGKMSKENIWEIGMGFDADDPNSPDDDNGNKAMWAEAQFGFFGTFLKGSLTDNRKNNAWVATDASFMWMVDTATDARFKSIFSRTAASSGDVAGYLLKKYTNFLYRQADTKTGAYLNNNLVIFRLSDILLLDAEALANLGDLSGAKMQLAKTEDRAGVKTYEDASDAYSIIDEVVQERGRELVGEGTWFYDLIRTNATQGWLEYIGYPAERLKPEYKGYYWPLDMSSLFPQNTLLTQNPWWASHK
jgi:hypothetical protein